MRQTLSILLVFVHVFQAAHLSAQDIDSTLTLEERIRNMDAEVERFVRLKSDMPAKDIFLSNASEGLKRAKLCVNEFEQQDWSVWWDCSVNPLDRRL